jgi:hypothetical protein
MEVAPGTEPRSEGFRDFIGRVTLGNSATAPDCGQWTLDSMNGFCAASHIKFCERVHHD